MFNMVKIYTSDNVNENEAHIVLSLHGLFSYSAAELDSKSSS
jgi:hypothetical protein